MGALYIFVGKWTNALLSSCSMGSGLHRGDRDSKNSPSYGGGGKAGETGGYKVLQLSVHSELSWLREPSLMKSCEERPEAS